MSRAKNDSTWRRGDEWRGGKDSRLERSLFDKWMLSTPPFSDDGFKTEA